jgi:biofilm protein TabA
MKNFNTLKTPALILFLMLMSYAVMAQTDSLKKVREAKKWVKSREWGKGLKVNVFNEVNSVEFERQYKSNPALWDKVFTFLGDSSKLALPPGKYPIDGDNAFAIISDGPTKTPDAVKWESHRKYIDLHYVIRGAENLYRTPITKATVIIPYDETRDAANYTAEGKIYTATPAEFFLFFPTDVHKAGIKADGFDTDKKLVIKILYTK